MKKYLKVIIALLIVLSLCACSAGTQSLSNETPGFSDTSSIETSDLTSSETLNLDTGLEQKKSFSSKLEVPNTAKQVLHVVADGTQATISMHTKDENGWREILSTAGYVGKAGLGQASEGAKTTPQGVYTLTKAFGIKENPGTSLPYTKVTNAHYWVDDPNSKYYNKFVDINEINKDWSSAEHLIEYTISYAYAVVIDYNENCTPGKGSAFFVHCSTGKPTYGCVAVQEEDMIFILKNLSDNAYIILENK